MIVQVQDRVCFNSDLTGVRQVLCQRIFAAFGACQYHFVKGCDGILAGAFHNDLFLFAIYGQRDRGFFADRRFEVLGHDDLFNGHGRGRFHDHVRIFLDLDRRGSGLAVIVF